MIRLLGDAVQSGPHQFRPLGRLRHRNKCARCYVPRDEHPVEGWVDARPIGDKRESPHD